jgi:hypothetical protein
MASIVHVSGEDLEWVVPPDPLQRRVGALPENRYLPSVFFGHSANKLFAECQKVNTRQRKNTRQRLFCRVANLTLGKEYSAKSFFTKCQIWHSAKQSLSSVFFLLTLDKEIFQNTFWGSKLTQIKRFWTTKLLNSSRCTMFILVICSFDKLNVNLFTNLTCFS